MATTGTTAEPAAASPRQRRNGTENKPYFVFETTAKDLQSLKPGDAVTFVAKVDANTAKDARWAAVDKVGGDLAKRTKVKAGEEGGVYLVPIAASNAKAVLTRDEIVEQSVRK